MKTGQNRPIDAQTTCVKCIFQLFKFDLRIENCSPLLRKLTAEFSEEVYFTENKYCLKDSLFTVPPESDFRQTSEAAQGFNDRQQLKKENRIFSD